MHIPVRSQYQRERYANSPANIETLLFQTALRVPCGAVDKIA